MKIDHEGLANKIHDMEDMMRMAAEGSVPLGFVEGCEYSLVATRKTNKFSAREPHRDVLREDET